MEDNTRVCRKCLIYDAAEADASEIDKYLKRLHPEELVSDEVFERRINICKSCEYLLGATCNKCGCYVEFRANVKQGTCPKKKWK
ncbi:MAG: DUF6171 family protein [Eubacterium sp.]|nr:DUF6171 family protein [Eubacterium sp.]